VSRILTMSALLVVAAIGCSQGRAKPPAGGGGMGGDNGVPDGLGGVPGSGGSGNDGGGAGTSSTSVGGAAGMGGSTVGRGGGGGGISTGGTAGSCGVDRLTAAAATSLYTSYAFERQPGLNPTVIFEARELDVAGLWEGLNAQLFFVSGKGQGGSFFRDCTILTHACQVFVPEGECSQGVIGLASGVVTNGAFYFSWGSGSGIYRSRLGKFAPNGAQFVRTVSPEYFNAGLSGPPLVLQVSGADILVYRASSYAFNGPPTGDPIGKVKDLGDALSIVDDTGRAIPSMLP
jgi:hypothetical protein